MRIRSGVERCKPVNITGIVDVASNSLNYSELSDNIRVRYPNPRWVSCA